jgi:hypothetical protein
MLNRIEMGVMLVLAIPSAIAQIMLQQLPIALFETTVKPLFTLVNAPFQLGHLLGMQRHGLPQSRAKMLFDKFRAATQGTPQPVQQAKALVERTSQNLVAISGITADFQVVETLDFTGNLGYILPSSGEVDAIDSADSLQLHCGQRRIQHQ